MDDNTPKRPSQRQAEILELVAQGLGDKQIALRLGISVHTVRTHLARVFKDQGLPNRAAAASAWTDARAEPSSALATRRRGLLVGRPLVLVVIAFLVLGAVLAGRALTLVERPAGVGRTTAPAVAKTTASRPQAPAPATPTPGAGSQPAPQVTVGPIVVPPKPLAPTPTPDARAVFDAVNGARTAANLPPLRWSDCLASQAQAAGRTLANGGSLASLTGLCGTLAVGGWATAHLPAADDQAATSSLLADPVRRAQLLSPAYGQAGAAWAVGPAGAYLVFALG